MLFSCKSLRILGEVQLKCLAQSFIVSLSSLYNFSNSETLTFTNFWPRSASDWGRIVILYFFNLFLKIVIVVSKRLAHSLIGLCCVIYKSYTILYAISKGLRLAIPRPFNLLVIACFESPIISPHCCNDLPWLT